MPDRQTCDNNRAELKIAAHEVEGPQRRDNVGVIATADFEFEVTGRIPQRSLKRTGRLDVAPRLE